FGNRRCPPFFLSAASAGDNCSDFSDSCPGDALRDLPRGGVVGRQNVWRDGLRRHAEILAQVEKYHECQRIKAAARERRHRQGLLKRPRQFCWLRECRREYKAFVRES